MYEVIGIAEKKGVYNDRPYHNVMLHCVCCESEEQTYGHTTFVGKVKFANVPNVFGKPMSYKDWNELLGQKVDIFYDRYGNMCSVRVHHDSK